MKYYLLLPVLSLLIFCGCNDKKKVTAADPVVYPSAHTQLKLGMQEVHFSQISAVNAWGFADITQAKNLFDYMDDLKISTFRYTIFWTSAEFEDGAANKFEWTRHDVLIDYLKAKGIKLTVTLFGDHYRYDTVNIPCSSPYPDNAVAGYWNAWLNYIDKTVRHFSSKVDRWEIWNEPDFAVSGSGIFWKPAVSADNFSAMLKVTSATIKDIQPNATVVMGGVTNFDGYRSFLASCFNNGVLDYIDEIGVHLYRSKPEGPFDYIKDITADGDPNQAGIQSPATFSEEISSLRAFVDSYRKDFPIRNTEEGFHIGSSAREDYSQMKYLTRMILVEHAQGINEITCFRLRAPRRSDFPADAEYDDDYADAVKFPGIIDQNDDGSFTPRPAYYGIKNMAKYLVGPDVYYQRSHILTAGGYTVRAEIYEKNGLPLIAYWIEETINNSQRAVSTISITLDGIGNHAFKVADIKDNSFPDPGVYSPSGDGMTFSSLPATDYPYILIAQ